MISTNHWILHIVNHCLLQALVTVWVLLISHVILEKIVAIVPCDITDKTRPLAAIDDDAKAMSQHLIEFFQNEIKHGRLPKNLLPLQSGVGSVANAVISGLAQGPFTNLSIFTEVIQDGMFDLIDAGKVEVCSGTALSPSPDGLNVSMTTLICTRRKLFFVRKNFPIVLN